MKANFCAVKVTEPLLLLFVLFLNDDCACLLSGWNDDNTAKITNGVHGVPFVRTSHTDEESSAVKPYGTLIAETNSSTVWTIEELLKAE